MATAACSALPCLFAFQRCPAEADPDPRDGGLAAAGAGAGGCAARGAGAPPSLPAPGRRVDAPSVRGRLPTGCSADEMGPRKDPSGAFAAVDPPRPRPAQPGRLPRQRRARVEGGMAKFFPGMLVDVLKTGRDFACRQGPRSSGCAATRSCASTGPCSTRPNFSYAILDEGQFIKNPDAKVTQTCFAVRARHRLVLTGTPLENRQLDLWSIFRSCSRDCSDPGPRLRRLSPRTGRERWRACGRSSPPSSSPDQEGSGAGIARRRSRWTSSVP